MKKITKPKLKFILIGQAGRTNRQILLGIGATIFLIAFILWSLPEPHIMSSPEVSIMRDRGVLRVGLLEDMPGFNQNDEGLEAQLAELLGDYLLPDNGPLKTVERVTVNSRTAIPHLDNGDVDVIIAMQVKDANSSYVYSTSYYTDVCRYVVLAGNEHLNLQTADIGTVQTSVLNTRLKNHMSEAHYLGKQITFASYPELLGALKSNRIDAALVQSSYLSRFWNSGLSLHEEIFGTVDYALLTGSDSPAFAQLMTILINDLKGKGALSAMLKAHNLPEYVIE